MYEKNKTNIANAFLPITTTKIHVRLHTYVYGGSGK